MEGEGVLGDRKQLIELIERLLSDVLEDRRGHERGRSVFHCREAPSVSVRFYLERMSHFTHCSNAIFVVVLIYLDRLQERNEGLLLNEFCVHRLLITGVMVAAKFYDDFYYKNEYYAKIGGIANLELNLLEREFLRRIHHCLIVTHHEFQMYLTRLHNYRTLH